MREAVPERVTTPDLLSLEPYSSVDRRQLEEIFGMAFLGREPGTKIDQALANARVRSHGWNPSLFAASMKPQSRLRTPTPTGLSRGCSSTNRAWPN